MEKESVWRALTSPHRRKILDILREGPRTTGQIWKQMPGLSRFAVMQHLDVLQGANLLLVRREGRERFNYANPAPIREVYERWVTGFSSAAATTAQHMKRYAEEQAQEHNMSESPFRVVKIELEVEIIASPEIVFDALTKNLNAWWPHRFKPGSTVRHEARLGGNVLEEWDGGGAVYGSITAFDPPHKITTVVAGFMGCYTATNDDVVEATESGAIYKKSLRLWGDISDDMERMFRDGSAAIMKEALKGYCEEGNGHAA